jgi:4-aminobutyrate--pyruvate transaminase
LTKIKDPTVRQEEGRRAGSTCNALLPFAWHEQRFFEEPSMSMTTPAARRDLSFHLHPATNLRAVQAEGPLVITRGEGVYVYDDEGRRYLEGMAGLWCASLGFSERRLAEAAYKQMCELPFYHAFAGKVPAISTELAQRLIAMAPGAMGRVLFANSGSEANDTAVKLAWYINNGLDRPQKKKIISRQRAYHGVTVASASLTGLAFAQNDFDLPIARILHTDCPHYYRGAQPGESEEAFAARLAANLEQLILREGPDTVAAFFAEPVMGAGGVITPPATYFDRVQPILRKYDILFVVDEVICGFGRTGNMFGSQTYNLTPDMMTLAKALTSGYLPMSANLLSNRLYDILLAQSDKLGIFGHGYTYSSHPVPAAVAIETLKIYEERDIVGQVRRVGPRMQAGIRSFADHPLIGEARGIGLIGAVELVRDKATKQSFDPKAGVAAHLVRRAQHHGAILRNMPGDIVAFSPPLVIGESEIDEMMHCFGKALDDTHAMVREKGLI